MVRFHLAVGFGANSRLFALFPFCVAQVACEPVTISFLGCWVFLLLLFGMYYAGLPDEVYDAQDYLLVKKSRLSDKIPLDHISRVSIRRRLRVPDLVNLSLARQSKFGKEIFFSPIIEADGGFAREVRSLIGRIEYRIKQSNNQAP